MKSKKAKKILIHQIRCISSLIYSCYIITSCIVMQGTQKITRYPRSIDSTYNRWSWKGDKHCEPPSRSGLSDKEQLIQPEREKNTSDDTNMDTPSQPQIHRELSQELMSNIHFETDTHQVRNNNTFLRKDSNKREDTYTKMAEREMIRQVGTNPFLNNSYVDGITIRDTVLMPYHESKPKIHKETI